jgi:hypothetical protein
MKKLIFLLLMAVALVGLISATAGAAHPPGALALEIALSGYGVHEAAVTPDTVLATQCFFSLPASILALPDTIDFTGQPHNYMIKSIETMTCNWPDYWLRL